MPTYVLIDTRRSLARSNHTLTVIGNKAYIFGGEIADNKIASNDIHAVTLEPSGKPESDYHLIPAIPKIDNGAVPSTRTKHAACSFKGSVAIFGGCSENGKLVDEGSTIWLFDSEAMSWSTLEQDSIGASKPGPRSGAKLFEHENSLILYGGKDNIGSASDVWRFDTDSHTWTQLPTAPVHTANAAFTNGQLYLISGSDPMSSQLHHLDVSSTDEDSAWQTFTFPTNPIAPGPRPRQGGGLLPISTGFGRNYLTYFLGSISKPADSSATPLDETHDVTQWSDMWTLQLPSSNLEAKPKLKVSEAIKPAKIKDAIRAAFGADTGTHSWAEAEVQIPELREPEGKLHPGPRGFFGCDVMGDGKSVVLWGGENAKGERVGDGWIVRLE